MAITALRTAVIYIVLIAALRLAGKRQLGELQPVELVVTLLIADLAVVPIQDNGTPLLSGLVPIAVLVALELILSALMMKCGWLSQLISGNPVVIIREGKLEQKALRRLRLTVEDLTETLRQQNVFDLREVQYAIAETNGTVSLFLYADARTVTCGNLRGQSPAEEAPVPVVEDGRTVAWGMALCGVSPQWVQERLRRRGYALHDVLLMTADKQHKVHIIPREGHL